jgi:hypothetical protein
VNRREFLEALAAASAAGLPLASPRALAAEGVPSTTSSLRQREPAAHHGLPRALKPLYFREPAVNIGVASQRAIRTIAWAINSSPRME